MTDEEGIEREQEALRQISALRANLTIMRDCLENMERIVNGMMADGVPRDRYAAVTLENLLTNAKKLRPAAECALFWTDIETHGRIAMLLGDRGERDLAREVSEMRGTVTTLYDYMMGILDPLKSKGAPLGPETRLRVVERCLR